MFNQLLRDTISIIKSDGNSINNLKASVQSNMIYLHQSDILVEVNDIIERRMSNGGIEQYRVIDPCFHEGLGAIPAGYQMKVEKLGLPQKQNVTQTVYNIGDNAKIYNNSVDMSINIHNHNAEIVKILDELKSEIEKISNESQKQETLEIYDEIREQCVSDKPKRTVINALMNSLPPIDNIASIANSLMAMFGK